MDAEEYKKYTITRLHIGGKLGKFLSLFFWDAENLLDGKIIPFFQWLSEWCCTLSITISREEWDLVQAGLEEIASYKTCNIEELMEKLREED